jgi:Ca2+-binding EF-hand superfamily protein
MARNIGTGPSKSLLTAKAVFIFVTLFGSALAQNPPSPSLGPQKLGPPPWPSQPEATEYLFSFLSTDITYEKFVQRLPAQFRELDWDSDGQISQSDVELETQFAVAHNRAFFAANLIMHADLDGDGVVTEDELRRYLHVDRRSLLSNDRTNELIEAEVRRIMAADADHDGRITFGEAEKSVEALSIERVKRGDHLAESIRQLVQLAPQGKTALTQADFEVLYEALFRVVDSDGNGIISANEREAYRDKLRAAGH